MKRLSWTVGLAALAAATALAGCASNKQPTKGAIPASEVKVYENSQLLAGRYQIVQHIWIDPWSSAFGYPTFATEDKAVEAMRAAAGKAGAAAVTNVNCVSAKGWRDGQLLCSGDAIRFN